MGHRSTVVLVEHMRKKATREEKIYAKQKRIGKKLFLSVKSQASRYLFT
jgi:hypothetical protein